MPHPDRPRRAARVAKPSDELVLTAIERAACHQARDTAAVPAWAILEHLAIPRRSAAARHVRERLAAMHDGGWLERSQRHSVPTWALSRTGLEHLRRARGADELGLPESPQHRTWREARTAAAQEIERFRTSLRERLALAEQTLEASEPPHSDAWLELAEELRRACQRLASASYCLYEWVEPDDALADVDQRLEPADEGLEPTERAVRRARRAGRRNVRLWDERAGC